MGSDKLCCALLSDNRRSHCALGWTSGQTYLIKLEDLGDDCFPVVFFFFFRIPYIYTVIQSHFPLVALMTQGLPCLSCSPEWVDLKSIT